MKIVIVNTCDIVGGAARSAYRLHKGLLEIGESSRMLVRTKDSADKSVYKIKPIEQLDDTTTTLRSFFWNIQNQYINQNRTDLSNTLFFFPYPGFDISELPLVKSADVINLHWIDKFQSPVTLRKLLDLKKPVVWTLHDEWAFTGGCHYTAECQGYTDNCSNCPQLKDNSFNITSVVLEDKLKLFADTNLTIVTPSHWLSSCVKKSKLFRKFRVETIPYSLETDIFKPLQKETTKRRLGISEQITTILFGTEYGNEKRKGFKQLMEAINFCLKDSKFQDLIRRGLIKVLCFGQPSDDLKSLPIDSVSLGYIKEDQKISEIYSAADIFILPSLEDNLPNTMLESMSCGTPVVAFDTGGMPDLVKDGLTGKLAPFLDTKKMGEAILDLIFHPEKCAKMGIECRKKMESKFNLTVQAKNYIALYQDLVKKSQASTSKTTQNTGKEFFFNTEEQAVNLDTSLGPGFQNSDGNILTKMLLRVYHQEMANKNQTIKKHKQMITNKDQQIAERDAVIRNQDAIIKNLEKSLTFRLTAPLRKLWHLLPESCIALCKKFLAPK